MDDVLDEAIAFTAEGWSEWSERGGVPSNVNVRDRLAFFVAAFREISVRQIPGVAVGGQSGASARPRGSDRPVRDGPRRQIEAALGISLPGAG